MASFINFVLLVLLTITLILVTEAAQKRRAIPSEEEKKELERQLKAINKPAIKSFKTEQGDIFDCIDIHKQLAFDHHLLKNHSVQLKPTTVPEWITSNNISGKVDPLLLLQEGINCPDGTVIVKRTTMQDLIHAQRLKSMGFDGPRHFLTERNNTDGTGQFYVATVDYGPKSFTGVKGHLNVWNPQVSQDQISLAFMAVAGGPKERFASIFVGWMACREWGFFYVTNHGISKEMFNRIYSLSRDVFNVPLESKLKLGPFSYTPRYIASPYFESLVVSGPDFSGSAKASADVLFQDDHKPELRESLQEYAAKMADLSKRLVKILLMMTLGDETGKRFYQNEFSNCHGYLRLVNYTPPHDVEKQEELVEGLGMHTDMSCITIVYQDSVGGLQMRSKEEKWIDINPCEDLLVVNIGDLMQAWSNGRLRSSEHRVVLRKLVNRVSVAFFLCFEDEKVILAPQEIVGEGNCRSYKSFKCSEYLKFRQSNEAGKFERIGYTVKDFAGLKPPQPDDP